MGQIVSCVFRSKNELCIWPTYSGQQMAKKGLSFNKYVKDVKNKTLSLHMDLNLHRIDSLAVSPLSLKVLSRPDLLNIDSIYCQEQTQGQDLGKLTGTLENLEYALCYRAKIPKMEGGRGDTTHLGLCSMSQRQNLR